MKTLIAVLTILVVFLVIRNGLPQGSVLKYEDISIKADARNIDLMFARFALAVTEPQGTDHVIYKTSVVQGVSVIAYPYSGWVVLTVSR